MKPWMQKLLAGNNSVIMSGRDLAGPPWTPSEKLLETRLPQKQSTGYEAGSLGNILTYNKSYMDVVDWAYPKLGPLEVFLGFIFLLFPIIFVGVVFMLRKHIPDDSEQIFYSYVLICLNIFVCICSTAWLGRALLKTLTGYTHYPVRLDRKNQLVHVFRHNGEGGVSSYKWRDIRFGLLGGGAQERGYIQRPDKSYDHFRLGAMWPTPEGMYGQWEFYRRYMEEGPDRLEAPEYLLPLDTQREPFRLGAQQCWLVGGPLPFVIAFFAPLSIPGTLVRWVAMNITRKMPRWPQRILDLCPVAPDDPYASREYRDPNVSLGLALGVTIVGLAIDAALVYWFVDWLTNRHT